EGDDDFHGHALARPAAQAHLALEHVYAVTNGVQTHAAARNACDSAASRNPAPQQQPTESIVVHVAGSFLADETALGGSVPHGRHVDAAAIVLASDRHPVSLLLD